MIDRKPVLCIIGPLLGKNGGYITTAAEVVEEKFIEEGYTVYSASSKVNPILRLFDILSTIYRRRKSYNIILLQVYGYRSFLIEDAARRLAQLLGKKTIMVLHGGEIKTLVDEHPRWFSAALRSAAALAAPSVYMSKLIAPLGFACAVIPNVIDLHQYPYRERRKLTPRMLWMRTFYSYYNPLMAVRVLERVRRRYTDATLVMGGYDAGMMEEVKTFALQQGLDGAIEFPGFLGPEAKVGHFSECDFYLNTNDIDNMPVSVIEACAMGVPVVTTNVGGIPDMMEHGTTAMLVNANDDAQMADAVIQLLSDEELANRLSVKGREFAESCSWEAVHARYREMFNTVLS